MSMPRRPTVLVSEDNWEVRGCLKPVAHVNGVELARLYIPNPPLSPVLLMLAATHAPNLEMSTPWTVPLK